METLALLMDGGVTATAAATPAYDERMTQLYQLNRVQPRAHTCQLAVCAWLTPVSWASQRRYPVGLGHQLPRQRVAVLSVITWQRNSLGRPHAWVCPTEAYTKMSNDGRVSVRAVGWGEGAGSPFLKPGKLYSGIQTVNGPSTWPISSRSDGGVDTNALRAGAVSREPTYRTSISARVSMRTC